MMNRKQLPQDAVEEILSRLPIKTVAKCKCICKSWNALISSRHFVKHHLVRTLSDPNFNPFRILLYWPYKSLDYESPSSLVGVGDEDDAKEDLGFPLGPEGPIPIIDRRVVGSCDGLIALLYDFVRIILWNPSIRVARELPPPPPSPFPNATSFYGLGYDNAMDDYKIIKVVRSNSTKKTIAYVFSISGASWRTIEGPDKTIAIHKEDGYDLYGLKGIFLHGALHWRATRGVGAEKLGIILRFDLTEETFSELTQPAVGDPSKTFEFLCALNGSLCLLSRGYGVDFDVWVMRDYGICTSWTILFSIDDDFENGEFLSPACFVRNGDIIIDIDGIRLARYDVRLKTSEFLKTEGFQWSVYVQSMVSPLPIIPRLDHV